MGKAGGEGAGDQEASPVLQAEPQLCLSVLPLLSTALPHPCLQDWLVDKLNPPVSLGTALPTGSARTQGHTLPGGVLACKGLEKVGLGRHMAIPSCPADVFWGQKVHHDSSVWYLCIECVKVSSALLS